MRFVYFLRCGNEYKVGIAYDLKKRLASIQTSNAKKVELVAARRAINAQILEKQLHQKLKEHGGNGGREWFTLTPQKAIDVAIDLNRSPETATADLIIEDLQIDLRKIITGYWENLDREMRKGGALAKPIEAPQPNPKVVNVNPDTSDKYDEFIEHAKNIVSESGKASTSFLQRRMRIGYSRAANIIEELEKQGIVGPADGSRAREVYVQSGEMENAIASGVE